MSHSIGTRYSPTQAVSGGNTTKGNMREQTASSKTAQTTPTMQEVGGWFVFAPALAFFILFLITALQPALFIALMLLLPALIPLSVPAAMLFAISDESISRVRHSANAKGV